MLCVVDVEIGSSEAEKARAADELIALFEFSMARARREAAKLPPLYMAGVKYVPQPKEACAFRPPADVHKRRGGDCKQLVLWRIAELRNTGEHATPRIIWVADKAGFRAHAQVRRVNGDIEDPSYNLGMKKP